MIVLSILAIWAAFAGGIPGIMFAVAVFGGWIPMLKGK
jgi:hypothetical protein